MIARLFQQLDEHARQQPNSTAVVEVHDGRQGRTLTWACLRDAVATLAADLRRKLPADGSVVLIRCSNRIEFPVALLGTLFADAHAFPVSPDLTSVEFSAAARQSAASLIIGAPTTHDEAVQTRIAGISLDDLLRPRRPLTHIGPVFEKHRGVGALLLQSSGTTGMPRIVRRSMVALDAVAGNCVQALSMTPDDRMLVGLPVFHSYGLEHGVLSCLMAGCTLELHRQFDPASMRKALGSGRVSLFPGVPFAFDMLSQLGRVHSGGRLRHAYSAGAPLPTGVAKAFEAAFDVPLGQFYGATEFGSVTFNDPSLPDADPACVGSPLNGVELRIVDAHDPEMGRPLPPDQEGQIVVAAPSMFDGYIDEHRPPTLQGFFPSGDLGRLDAKGRLTITGRIKLLIDVGGLKVNPREVEAVLAEHPAVAEAVVVPMPVTQTLCRLKAVVRLHPLADADAKDLREFAQQRLSAYKVPRVFEVRTTFPRTPTGKVIRQALQCS